VRSPHITAAMQQTIITRFGRALRAMRNTSWCCNWFWVQEQLMFFVPILHITVMSLERLVICIASQLQWCTLFLLWFWVDALMELILLSQSHQVCTILNLPFIITIGIHVQWFK
jgi:hypothetical protein